MILTISGPSGSGKTTIAKIVSKKFNLRYISGGEFFRSLALKESKDIIQFNREAEKLFNIDKLIDSKMLEEALKGDVVIESHIAGWILKGIADYSIYLWAPLEERAKRIASRDRLTYSDAIEKIIEREQSHHIRFWKYYGIDIFDESVFDLVINTQGKSPEMIINLISMYIRND
ncbi:MULTISPECIES: (d)CMP kinase [Acidianus]|uniref:(d)CMP kinase n=1 Tax=Acidianus TaxID=12914 RepID=UPI00064FDF1D|nr:MULTISPECIES: AAA family ATPase [Acidianus]NON63482.1 AAA family ATPase [Acidianus sp. RZ1]